jgi:hypothetical protein
MGRDEVVARRALRLKKRSGRVIAVPCTEAVGFASSLENKRPGRQPIFQRGRCGCEQHALQPFAKELTMNKILAALIAATFSFGAFAQAASAPAAATGTKAEGSTAAPAKAEKKAKAKKAKAKKASKAASAA